MALALEKQQQEQGLDGPHGGLEETLLEETQKTEGGEAGVAAPLGKTTRPCKNKRRQLQAVKEFLINCIRENPGQRLDVDQFELPRFLTQHEPLRHKFLLELEQVRQAILAGTEAELGITAPVGLRTRGPGGTERPEPAVVGLQPKPQASQGGQTPAAPQSLQPTPQPKMPVNLDAPTLPAATLIPGPPVAGPPPPPRRWLGAADEGVPEAAYQPACRPGANGLLAPRAAEGPKGLAADAIAGAVSLKGWCTTSKYLSEPAPLAEPVLSVLKEVELALRGKLGAGVQDPLEPMWLPMPAWRPPSLLPQLRRPTVPAPAPQALEPFSQWKTPLIWF